MLKSLHHDGDGLPATRQAAALALIRNLHILIAHFASFMSAGAMEVHLHQCAQRI